MDTDRRHRVLPGPSVRLGHVCRCVLLGAHRLLPHPLHNHDLHQDSPGALDHSGKETASLALVPCPLQWGGGARVGYGSPLVAEWAKPQRSQHSGAAEQVWLPSVCFTPKGAPGLHWKSRGCFHCQVLQLFWPMFQASVFKPILRRPNQEELGSLMETFVWSLPLKKYSWEQTCQRPASADPESPSNSFRGGCWS